MGDNENGRILKAFRKKFLIPIDSEPSEIFCEIDMFLTNLFYLSRSPTIIKYISNSFLFSKRSLNKKLLNIDLIKVDESDDCIIVLEILLQGIGFCIFVRFSSFALKTYF